MLLDLGADGAVETPLGGEPSLDLVALRRARRDEPVLPGAFDCAAASAWCTIWRWKPTTCWMSAVSCFDIEFGGLRCVT